MPHIPTYLEQQDAYDLYDEMLDAKYPATNQPEKVRPSEALRKIDPTKYHSYFIEWLEENNFTTWKEDGAL